MEESCNEMSQNSKFHKARLNKPLDLRTLSAEEIKQYKSQSLNYNPFKDMKITNGSFLDKVDGRSSCKICGKSRKYFCYTCYVPLPELEKDIPTVKLPCMIDIIKHPKETDGKSTAIHASIIAPDQVRIYTYPDIPNYYKENQVYLMFPDESAVALQDFLTLFPTNDDEGGGEEARGDQGDRTVTPPIGKIVFIDSTWNQSKRIYNDERLKNLPCLQLNSRETLFWRYQKGKPKTYLATIEAIFYFVKDYHTKFVNDNYDGEYDNLLFFFKYMYEKIHSLYNSDTLLAYKDV